MKKLFVAILFGVIFYPIYAYADLIWPAVYIREGNLSLFVILSGLLTEIFFVKYFAKIPFKNAFKLAVVMNLITGVLGFFFISGVGFLLEMFLIGSTFSWIHWTVNFIVIVLANTLIEGAYLKKKLKLPFKKHFWWLFVANTCSIGYCIMYLLFFKEVPFVI